MLAVVPVAEHIFAVLVAVPAAAEQLFAVPVVVLAAEQLSGVPGAGLAVERLVAGLAALAMLAVVGPAARDAGRLVAVVVAVPQRQPAAEPLSIDWRMR